MIFGKNANLMLKYQKAKAKMVEYDVSKQEYPHFPLNSNELSYPTTYVLSRYSECMIEDNQDELNELQPFLSAVAEYYDSAFKSKDRQDYDWDFLLSGASAYFLKNDFGSAKVLAQKAVDLIDDEKSPQKLLVNFYNYLLDGAYLPYLQVVDTYERINNFFLDYFGKGNCLEALKANLSVYRRGVYESEDPDSIFYVDILVAVIIVACNNSSWRILPNKSDVLLDKWEPYLQSKMSIKMLWPAQRLIAEKGLLRGENAIVQLPTGVGKTRSIELIIRAAFLSERANTAIIIAPLRALCNEITADMYRAFGDDVIINQFSDVLQNDFWNLFSKDKKKQILICTPEKLSYVLHHDSQFLAAMDLLIFDEGHMFDDGGRGATYELLVTHIRQNKSNEQQLVLLSAVLPNSEEIKNWLFSNNGSLAKDERIVSTPKTIGFTSTQKDVHFFSDNKDEEDYYIPRVLQTKKLKRLPRERTDKIFPKLSSPIDVALYNAIKLCRNGGVAIYIGQQRSMKTVFTRVLDIDKHGYDLETLKDNANREELLKIKKFMEKYYGAEHHYTKVAQLGVLPHSSSLQNGVKLVVEHALKNKDVSCVVCTSTLAQGVNIPIKYLLVTSIRNGLKLVKVRDFQNLIGRTARAGVYTEGSIIITDSRIYDNRNTWKNRGKYVWTDCIGLFDSESAEPCSSSILSLVQDFAINHEHSVKGEEFIGEVIAHFGEREFLRNYAKDLEAQYLKVNPDGSHNSITNEILLREEILSNLENYLCLMYSTIPCEDGDESFKSNICENTLAYSLASEKEKELLKQLFAKIEEHVKTYPLEQLHKYSNTMSSIELSSRIEKWIADKELAQKEISEEELLRVIVDFYQELKSFPKYKEKFLEICQFWIEGKTPKEINNELDVDITEIDSICNKRISYELNFLIGNICDLVGVDEENELSLSLKSTLTKLQKKVKYGVPTLTAISVCEKVFYDRILAVEFTHLLNDDDINGEKVISTIKNREDLIKVLLKQYPRYFQDKLEFLLQ